ncbi:MAG: DUF853 family protein [Chloroflexi bacterium]|nr:DUF853 family protein [Chloroflexota bacterium]
MTESNFYLGRYFNEKTGKVASEALNYDPADLTTHAVVTGMTGSGKTGLCIALLEEAALNGVPAIIIDPKGDLTNLLLHFPDLLPQDFQPWIDPEVVRRANKTPEQAATELPLPGATESRNGVWIKRASSTSRTPSTLPSTRPVPMQGFPSACFLRSTPQPWIGRPTARSCVSALPAPSPPCWVWSA